MAIAIAPGQVDQEWDFECPECLATINTGDMPDEPKDLAGPCPCPRCGADLNAPGGQG